MNHLSIIAAIAVLSGCSESSNLPASHELIMLSVQPENYVLAQADSRKTLFFDHCEDKCTLTLPAKWPNGEHINSRTSIAIAVGPDSEKLTIHSENLMCLIPGATQGDVIIYAPGTAVAFMSEEGAWLVAGSGVSASKDINACLHLKELAPNIAAGAPAAFHPDGYEP